MIYIIVGLSIAIIIIGVLSFATCIKQRRTVNLFKSHLIHSTQTLFDLRNKTLTQTIKQILSLMDETHSRYVDEDEANRELTTSLKALGHHAIYQHPLCNGRTIDIYVDDFALIEGKLDIDQSETDRLIGQIEDYMIEDYHHIYLVLYGETQKSLLKRIKEQIINRYPEKTTVIYLENAKRTRGEENEGHEIHQIFNRKCRASYAVNDHGL